MPSRTKTNSIPIFAMIGGGLLLVVAAVLLFNQNSSSPIPATAVEEGIPYPEIPRVSIEDTEAALESGSAIMLDVRSADAYAGSHIFGAVNIPLAELEARLGELDPDQWIITYCT